MNAEHDRLTDDEREALNQGAEEIITEAEAEKDDGDDDRPWLAADREAMKGFLTDEELAALADDEDTSDGEGADAGDVTDNNDDAAGETEPEPQPDGAKRTVELTQEEAAAIQAKMEARQDALLDQMDEGELTRAEYKAALAALKAEEAAEVERILQGKIASQADAEAAAFAESHKAAAKVFFAQNPAIAQDKTILARFDELQQQVTADRRFAGKDSMTIFAEARARLADEAKRDGREIPGITKAERPRHATREIPPTLAAIPAAAVNEPEGSALAKIAAQIDNADEMTRERIWLKLSPEQRDAILEGNY